MSQIRSVPPPDQKTQRLSSFQQHALALYAEGKWSEALVVANEALAISGEDVFLLNLAAACHVPLGDIKQAISCWLQAIRIKPDYAEAHSNLGLFLRNAKCHKEAESVYRKAIGIMPDSAEAHYDLGSLLHDLDRCDEAAECFRRVLEINPDHTLARWLVVFTKLAPLHKTYTEQMQTRENFRQELALLQQWFADRQWSLGKNPNPVGCGRPFYLAYHDEDNRELLTRYGNLCVPLMAGWRRGENLAVDNAMDSPPTTLEEGTGIRASTYLCPKEKARENRPIRIGVVSAFFWNHSVWNAIVKGWFTQFNGHQFDKIMAFSTSNMADDETLVAKSLGQFVAGKTSLREWVECILAAQLDVLIYPEVGMDAVSVQLASLRLAPVQIATWGHPETTGLSTIDYYLSAEMLEPDHSSEFYCEELIKLPNLGTYCSRMTIAGSEEVHPEQFGLRSDRPILICAGSPSKYNPLYEHVFIDLVRRIEGCQLVFFNLKKAETLCQALDARLEHLFHTSGLSYSQHVFFLPWLPIQTFHGLMRVSTVMLDTIGFSGFNTALQAVECGLPIVTLDGRFMRGRLGAGILRRLGLSDIIAKNTEEYVDLAVRFTTDTPFRAAIQSRMAEALPSLYEDMAPIEYLQNFLMKIVRNGIS